MKNYIIILIVISFLTFACDEQPIGQQPIDNVPPGPVTNVKVDNTPGGAIITYALPQDEDLLYVKAVYFLKEGIKSEARSSLFSDTLKIEGFGDTLTHQIKLIAVDRSRNESPEVVSTITPTEPFVISIGKTLNMTADFGGVSGFWENPLKAEVSVVFLQQDNNNEYVPIKTYYTKSDIGEGSQLGLDTLSSNFGIYVQDRWGNISEIKYYTLKPLFEEQLNPENFRAMLLPGDVGDSGIGYPMTHLWNNIIGNADGFDSDNESPAHPWPMSFTMDLGVFAKISRLVYWQIQKIGTWIDEYSSYLAGNPKEFEVWGCNTLDPSGNWDSWTKLMDCTSIKPSGLPYGVNSAEDFEWSAAGEQFKNSSLNPSVRYIRFRIKKTWSGQHQFLFAEISFFGRRIQ